MISYLKQFTAKRLIYIALGVSMIVHSLLYKQYLGIGIGAYFSLMGLLGFGCAGPNCGVPAAPKNQQTTDEVIFTEINE